ncbi:MAG: hypothetical protein AB1714_31915 [Acidobacteriota bacterium]
MLAIDVPVALLSGLALAEAGKNMLKSDDPNRHHFMRTAVLLFAAFFITPIPFYFFLGWPAWEVNFLWRWQDNLHDSPLYSATRVALYAGGGSGGGLARRPPTVGYVGRAQALRGRMAADARPEAIPANTARHTLRLLVESLADI